MRNWLFLLCLFVVACAGPQPVTQRPDNLFRDDLFAVAAERVLADQVFALSEEMKLYLRAEIAAQIRARGSQAGLIEALYKKGQLKLEYDASVTRNAAQAFEARAGNCLSLVIMTAAFAKELGLRVRYQSAYTEESVSRSSELLLRSGHVNVTLGGTMADARTSLYQSPLMVDFLPEEELRGLRAREISEETVVAMYMNNRAVEWVVQGRLDEAYAWAREAVRQSPGFLAAQNTLGVIYLRHGDLPQAAAVFNHVLERDPESKSALSNLAKALARQGLFAESEAVSRRLAQIEPIPPFHFFNLGVAAMKHEDFKAARDYFAREVARADYYHEFHFWLGLANFRLGDIENARKQFTLALENSTTGGERDLYAAKLALLRAHSD